MGSYDELDMSYLQLQSTCGQQVTQSGELLWQLPTVKVTYLFYQVINVKSRDELKKLYLKFHKAYGH